jgi:hypothetical protein
LVDLDSILNFSVAKDDDEVIESQVAAEMGKGGSSYQRGMAKKEKKGGEDSG